MDPLFRWVLAGVLLLGSPFTAIGAWEAIETSGQLRSHVRAEGTVVENRLVTDRRDGVVEQSYVPVVEFRNAQGQITRFTDGVGSLPPDYAVGERVPIAFDPAEPSRARITSWKRLWLVPTILIVVGLLPAVVCAVVFRRISR